MHIGYKILFGFLSAGGLGGAGYGSYEGAKHLGLFGLTSSGIENCPDDCKCKEQEECDSECTCEPPSTCCKGKKGKCCCCKKQGKTCCCKCKEE
ncbi:hypothetical protein MHLP_03745 [Candidatus Mycoplasma haematolamae str. Purdue]|uniref:Metallothionein n=1 Tax=Mycoplasma haematolamae (strain Purdue) TaxID=1212765 RepID=I7CKA5_MYCHA|nr:hypothetical protein [Candidatus Mycoplasma haematolamae]AFO52329.1 hypothetical protein MHLP_03745 [Candidatus Mycoplasma haematolamae str. Purdue]